MMIFLVLVICLLLMYFYTTRNHDYWKTRGVYYIKPLPIIGNLAPILLQKRAIGEYLHDIYSEHNDQPYVGIFLAHSPCLVVRDPVLIGIILNQEFTSFSDKMFKAPKKTDPIAAKTLISITGKEWKNTRAKLSPVFTPKRHKIIFDEMLDVGKKIAKRLNEGPVIELKEFAKCMAVDMISDTILGFDGKALSDPKNDTLRILSGQMFKESLIQSIRINSLFLVPELMEFLGIQAFPESAYQIMRDAVGLAFQKKNISGVNRGDYLDALLELRKNGPWEGNDGEIIVPNDENMVSHMFMFFSAGVDTTASNIAFTVLEMALRQDIQEKLRKELNESIEKHGGKITHESMSEMRYLDNFVNEVLRKHPPFPFLHRICTKDYIIPGTNIKIDKGVKIMIPTLGLHLDEKYYNDPETIIPERFDDIKGMKGKPYLPFSAGPRTCLALRFSLQLIKVIVISCLKNHKLTANENLLHSRIRMSPKHVDNTPHSKIFLQVYKLE